MSNNGGLPICLILWPASVARLTWPSLARLGSARLNSAQLSSTELGLAGSSETRQRPGMRAASGGWRNLSYWLARDPSVEQ